MGQQLWAGGKAKVVSRCDARIFHYILGREVEQALEREGICVVCGVRQKGGTQRPKFSYHAAPVNSAKHNYFGLSSSVFKLYLLHGDEKKGIQL